MSIAAVLNGLRESQQQLAGLIKAEYGDISAKKKLAGDNGDQLAVVDLRRDELRSANDMLTDSIGAWTRAKNVLIDNNDTKAAGTLTREALRFYDRAYRLFDPDTELSVPQSDKDEEPDNEAEAIKVSETTGPPVPPVQASTPGQRGDARDGTLLPPAPVPSEPDEVKEEKGADGTPDSDEEPAWLPKLTDSFTEALKQHTEGCDRQFEELRQELQKIADGTLHPELAKVINDYTEDGLLVALQGGANAQQLMQQLDGIDLAVLTEILAFFKDDEYSVDDLKTALSGGRWVNGKRWTRGNHQ